MLTRTPPLRVALLTTLRAPGLRWLLDEDTEYGTAYEIVVCLASDARCGELPHVREAAIPTHIHDLHAFAAGHGVKWTDLAARVEYDAQTAQLLTRYAPDLVILCGYLHILTAPMLEAYAGRLVNIHDADLTQLGPNGRPKYRGLRSTRDAILAGEPATRTTVHLVTSEVDVGPIVARSGPFPVYRPMVEAARAAGAQDILKAYAFAHREWMMRAVWGPLLSDSIQRVARDRAAFAAACAEVELKHDLEDALAADGAER